MTWLYLRLSRHRSALWLAGALVLLFAILLETTADARVGGGQGFSSGRGSSSGGRSGGGSGGGGGEAEVLFLLIHLAIEFPCIGIPLVLLFVAFMAYRAYSGSSGRTRVYENNEYALDRGPSQRAPKKLKGIDQLLEEDAAFSTPVFLDFAGLVHRRGLASASSGSWETMLPFIGERVRGVLDTRYGQKNVRDVVVGATRIERIAIAGSHATIRVRYETNLTLDVEGKTQHLFVASSWTFRRASDATSLAPEETVALGCPSCGSPVETTAMGACTSCDTPITKGQLQWTATAITIHESKRVKAPEVGFLSGGDEPSTKLPTLLQPDLTVQMRAFIGRHPDFDKAAFQERVTTVYTELQGAWSDNQWSRARPFVTDTLYQQLRFWIEGYTRHGLRNQLADVKLTSVRIVKVEEDAWYEAITVRIYGGMKDWTTDREGKTIGGNAKQERRFSEYWTFLRASGTGAASPPPGQCPSCAAPLDNIGSTGICGYCDAKISSGRFDWVLSRIDQAEVYRG